MHVLMTSVVPPSLHSGVGNVEYNLIHGLRNLGVEVSEYFPAFHSMALADFVKGLHLHNRTKGFDVVHGHTDITWHLRGALRTFHGVSALGEKYYVQERDHALMSSHKQKVYFMAHNALERACAHENACIAVSNYVKKALVRYYEADEDNVKVIYNGIDAQTFSPDEAAGRKFRKMHKIPSDAVLLTWVGHAEFNKGIHYLIETMNLLAKQRKAARVMLAIRSPLDKLGLRHHGMSAAALEKTVVLPPQQSLAPFYNASDVHLLTSVYEPFCLTLLEAMSCGKPVVASSSGGHVEVIPRKAGVITPLRDSKAMASEVLDLAVGGEKARRRMGGEARKLILGGFTKEHMVKNTLKFYRQQVE